MTTSLNPRNYSSEFGNSGSFQQSQPNFNPVFSPQSPVGYNNNRPMNSNFINPQQPRQPYPFSPQQQQPYNYQQPRNDSPNFGGPNRSTQQNGFKQYHGQGLTHHNNRSDNRSQSGILNRSGSNHKRNGDDRRVSFRDEHNGRLAQPLNSSTDDFQSQSFNQNHQMGSHGGGQRLFDHRGGRPDRYQTNGRSNFDPRALRGQGRSPYQRSHSRSAQRQNYPMEPGKQYHEPYDNYGPQPYYDQSYGRRQPRSRSPLRGAYQQFQQPMHSAYQNPPYSQQYQSGNYQPQPTPHSGYSHPASHIPLYRSPLQQNNFFQQPYGNPQSPYQMNTNLQQQLNSNFNYNEAMFDVDYDIQENLVHCVICNQTYKTSEKRQHLELHREKVRNIDIRPIDENQLRRFEKYNNQLKKAHGLMVKPIVEPQEFNVQYNPNEYVLNKITKYRDLDGPMVHGVEIQTDSPDIMISRQRPLRRSPERDRKKRSKSKSKSSSSSSSSSNSSKRRRRDKKSSSSSSSSSNSSKKRGRAALDRSHSSHSSRRQKRSSSSSSNSSKRRRRNLNHSLHSNSNRMEDSRHPREESYQHSNSHAGSSRAVDTQNHRNTNTRFENESHRQEEGVFMSDRFDGNNSRHDSRENLQSNDNYPNSPGMMNRHESKLSDNRSNNPNTLNNLPVMNRDTVESREGDYSERGGVMIGGDQKRPSYQESQHSSHRDVNDSQYSRGSQSRLSNREQNHSQQSGYPRSQPRLNDINESEEEYRKSSNIKDSQIPSLNNQQSIKIDEVVREANQNRDSY